SGLSNAWVVGDKDTIRRKALQLKFRREGAGMRFVPPAEWVYRATPIRPAPPAPEKTQEKAKEKEEDRQRRERDLLYLRQLDLARREWERGAGLKNAIRPGFRKIVAEIEDAVRLLRQGTGDEDAELELLQEVERVVKGLQEKARGGRK